MFLTRIEPQINQRTKQTEGLILWGRPQTGKSYDAIKYCTDRHLTFFTPPEKQNGDNAFWWDGYSQQDVVIIDEMGGHLFKPDFFCRLLDSCPLSVPIKSGTVVFNSQLIIFTSNRDPRTWWGDDVIARNPGVTRRLSLPITETKHYYHIRNETPYVRRTALLTPLTPSQTQDNHFVEEFEELDRTCEIIQTPTGAIRSTFRLTSDDVTVKPVSGHVIKDMGKYATGPKKGGTPCTIDRHPPGCMVTYNVEEQHYKHSTDASYAYN